MDLYLINTAVLGLAVWLLAVMVQVYELVTLGVDARTARDERVEDRAGRRRITEQFWTIPVLSTVGVALAFGVDFSGRLWFEQQNPRLALVVAVVVLLAALIGGLGVMLAMRIPERPSYATIREDILEENTGGLAVDRIEHFRSQVAEVDRRVGYLRTYPSRSVTSLLWRGMWLRLVPVVIGLVPTVCLVILALTTGDGTLWWWIAAALVLVALTYWLAWASSRASLRKKTAWRAIYATQRAEVEQLLADAAKSSKKRVAGLGDRVARALQILREQQG